MLDVIDACDLIGSFLQGVELTSYVVEVLLEVGIWPGLSHCLFTTGPASAI